MNLFNDLSSCINPKLKEVITATSHKYLKEEENKMKKVEKLANEIRANLKERNITVDSVIHILDKHVPVEKKFPKIMSDVGGLIILFYSEGVGRVLDTGKNHNYFIGYYDNKWNISGFTDCKIKVVK